MDKPKDPGDEIDEKELKKTSVYNDNKYTKEHKLGAKLAKKIKKNGIYPDSLKPEHKEALDLHLKHCEKKCILYND